MTPRLSSGAAPPGRGAGVGPRLRIRTFGEAEVLVDGQPAQWHSASARKLFFYLLSSPEGRTREEILNDLWGLAADPASTNRFRVTVHRVRSALGRPDALTEAYGRYHLAPAVFQASDVQRLYAALHAAEQAPSPEARLQAYEDVQAVYSGEYLAGEQADWARQAREEHRAAYVQACVDLSTLHCEAAACAQAVGALTRAVRADPFIGENHHQKLMTCLSVVAGPYAAVEHYRRFLRFLRDDLNDTPMPDTVELAARVKSGEPICARGQQVSAGRVPSCTLAGEGRCPAALRRALQLH